MAFHGLQLPVVGVLEHPTVYNHKWFLKLQNFLLPRPPQLLAGAVMRYSVNFFYKISTIHLLSSCSASPIRIPSVPRM